MGHGVFTDALHARLGNAALDSSSHRTAVSIFDHTHGMVERHVGVDFLVLPMLLTLAHDPRLLLVITRDLRFLPFLIEPELNIWTSFTVV